MNTSNIPTDPNNVKPFPNDPVELVLSRLDGVRSSRRGWMARCPAHDDRSPSLEIRVGTEPPGSVWPTCYAGCSRDDVLAAIGLEIRDLYPADNSRPARRRRARARKPEPPPLPPPTGQDPFESPDVKRLLARLDERKAIVDAAKADEGLAEELIGVDLHLRRVADLARRGQDATEEKAALKTAVSKLSPIEKTTSVKSDIAFKCENRRWRTRYDPEKGETYSQSTDCRSCFPCRMKKRAQWEGELMDSLPRWGSVRAVPIGTGKPAQALKKRITRMGRDYYGVPMADGSIVILTDADVMGEVFEPTRERVKALLSCSSTEKRARLDGSRRRKKTERLPKRPPSRKTIDLGETPLNPVQQEPIYLSAGCKPKREPKGAGPSRFRWDVSHLSESELERLFWRLGHRPRAYGRKAA